MGISPLFERRWTVKVKKLWKLYKELRRLRKVVKILEADLAEINRRYNGLNRDYGALLLVKVRDMQNGHYNRVSVMVPQSGVFDNPYIAVPAQKYIHNKISAQMKVKFFDDLFEQGYIKCTRYDDISEVYEILAIK